MVSRLDHAVIIACVAACLWIEQAHRIVIEAPTLTKIAPPAAAAPCADSDNMPYSASCLLFLKSGSEPETRWRTTAAERATTIG